jgi:hypothetical protein
MTASRRCVGGEPRLHEWTAMQWRISELFDLPADVVEQVDRVLKRELTVSTVAEKTCDSIGR